MNVDVLDVADSPRESGILTGERLRPAVLVLVALLPAAILFLWHASRYGGWLIDDAGISFAYARNLADGFGLVSQPGRVPVEGYSNPLWVLLIALLYWLKLFAIPFTPKLLSCALVLLAFVVFAAALLQIAQDKDVLVVAGLGLLLCAANPGFVIWCVSGLENPLFVLLTALLLLTCVRALRDDQPIPTGVAMYAGVLAAGLALTRPDGAIYFAVFPLALRLRHSGSSSFVTKDLLVYGLCMGVPFGAYLLFRHYYFDDWLPNTYYAKPGVSAAIFDLVQLRGSVFEKAGDLSQAIFPPIPLLVPLVLAPVATNLHSVDRRTLLLGIFVAVAFTSYLILPPDWMGEYRFGTVAFPLVYLLGFLVLRNAVRTRLAQASVLQQQGVLVVVACLSLIVSAPSFVDRMQTFAKRPVAPLEDVAASAWKLNELAAALALRHPTLLLPDLGGTLLLSQARVIDIAGLCDRDIGRIYHAGRSADAFAHYILRDLRPDLVHIHLFWAFRSGLTRDAEFKTTYLDLGGGDYVRRSSLPPGMSDEAALGLKARLTGPSSSAVLRQSLAGAPRQLEAHSR